MLPSSERQRISSPKGHADPSRLCSLSRSACATRSKWSWFQTLPLMRLARNFAWRLRVPTSPGSAAVRSAGGLQNRPQSPLVLSDTGSCAVGPCFWRLDASQVNVHPPTARDYGVLRFVESHEDAAVWVPEGHHVSVMPTIVI
jgi:hypothetical protein